MKHLSVRPAAAKLMISARRSLPLPFWESCCFLISTTATTTEYSTANVSIR